MTDLIYAVKINDLKTGSLRILDVKIGKTTNIQRTLKTYRRSARDIAVLDLWEPNRDLTVSQCETGVHYLAEKYAHSKQSEKFIFLQDKYDEFADNVSRLLRKTTPEHIGSKKVKKSSKNKWMKQKGKPKYVKFKNRGYDVTTWVEAVLVVAKQIYDEVDDFSPALKLKGQKKTYIAKRKNKLNHPRAIPGSPYYIERNITVGGKKRLISKLLNEFGYDESDLEMVF